MSYYQCDLVFVSGNLYLKLGKYRDAEQKYKELLNRNPENTDYYAKLQEAQQLVTADEKLGLLAEYREKFPRALAPARLLLNYATG